jgi:hypothetical protein
MRWLFLAAAIGAVVGFAAGWMSGPEKAVWMRYEPLDPTAKGAYMAMWERLGGG